MAGYKVKLYYCMYIMTFSINGHKNGLYFKLVKTALRLQSFSAQACLLFVCKTYRLIKRLCHCRVPDLPEHGKSIEIKPFTMEITANKVTDIIKEWAHGKSTCCWIISWCTNSSSNIKYSS